MAERMLFTADGYRTVDAHVRSLGGRLLSGAAEHQRVEGDHWIRRRQGCFDPDCTGCEECAIRVRPYRDAVEWLQRYATSLGVYGQERTALLAEIELGAAG